MLKSRPLAIRFIVFIIVPAVIALAFAARFLYSSLPPLSGVIALPGLVSSVTITRDNYGIPYIRGEHEEDVYFAMGVAHAQDRLWQLELQRRIAQGRLSEIFGKETLRQDIWFRTLDLYEAADTALPALSDKAHEALSAYAAGINAWLDTHERLPVEFTAHGIHPERWRVRDSLAWVKFFALDLAGNFNAEIERFLAMQALPPAYREFLHASYPEDAPVTVPDEAMDSTLGTLLESRKELEETLRIGGKFVGSNAWVVSGEHTLSGNPLLANDPHLRLQIPSLWYAVSLETPKLNVTGMSLVGLPLVVFGQNGHIAWAGTSMMADTQDLYFEQLDPANPHRYKMGDSWREFETRTEEIHVRADFPAFLRKALKPVVVKIRKTRHGPVISDVVGAFEQPVALRWTALDPGDTTFDAFFGLHKAENWDEFRRTMAKQVAPALNMLYADRRNNIGYLGVGRIPIRKKGEGTLPVPGWTDEYDWVGMIPANELPRSLNPAAGYLVSANNRIIGDAYPYFISHDWARPARAQRIEGLLREHLVEGKKFDIPAMQAIQFDTFSPSVAGLLKHLVAVRPKNAKQDAVLGKLVQWQGDMCADCVAATIFHVWTRHLREALFADEITKYWNQSQRSIYLDSVVAQTSIDQIRDALENQVLNWCNDVGTAEHESCAEILQRSLTAALHELEKLKGSNPNSWAWGQIQQTDYAHRPFAGTKLLHPLFGRRVSGGGGSPDTVNVASSYFDASEGYLQSFGAGFRQVIEVGLHQVIHTFMNSTGQSGHVLSPHYDDMILPFRDASFHVFDSPPTVGSPLVLTLRPSAQPAAGKSP